MKKGLNWLVWTVVFVAGGILTVASFRPGSLLLREIVAGVFFVLGGAFAGLGEGFLLHSAIDKPGDLPSSVASALFAAAYALPFIILFALVEGLIPLIGYGVSTDLFASLSSLSFLATAFAVYAWRR